MASFPFTCALVTGASSGIGTAMVGLLGEAGIGMVLVARRRDRLEELATRFNNVEVLAADLLTEVGLSAVEARIGDTTKTPVDLVVNNAGFGTSGLVQNLNVDRLTDEIRLNVIALTRLSHAAVTAMIPRGRGYLLNVSSVASFQAGPGLAVYCATKAYVTSFTEALHEELRGTGVRVTALCPGLTRTEFQSVSNTEGLSKQFPGFAWLDPIEVASAGLEAVADGRVLSIPGVLYKGLSAVSSITPRGLARRIAALARRR